MNNSTISNIFILILAGTLIWALFFKPPKIVEEIRVIERIDTIKVKVVEECVVYQEVVKWDTVFLASVPEDLPCVDSAKVVIPIETKVYQDSLYRAVVSGYKPSLDEMIIYQREKVTINTQRAKSSRVRFALTIGPQTGYYYTPKGWDVGVGFGATLGIAFDLSRNKRKYD